MFALLSRPVARRTLTHTVRCMSRKPPIHPTPPPGSMKGEPKQPETRETPEAESIPTTTLETTSSKVPTLDFSPAEPKQEPQRTGAKSSKGSLSTGERKRRSMTRVTLGLLGLAFGANVVYMGREWSEDELKEKKLKIEDAPSTRLLRTKERFTDLFDYFNKPAWPELLPPPYPAPHQKPYTLLLSLDDLLVTSTWDRQYGWRTAKRPGVDYFLAYISQFYEVVIFTSQGFYTADAILNKLDKFGFFITYRLYREATRTLDGKLVKDLSYLNRDLAKVVQIDTDPEHVSTHPENAIVLPKWKGDPQDKGLVAMIPFLESIAIYKTPDVRPIIKAYEGKDIAVEYGKLEAEMKRKHIEEWTKRNPNKRASAGPSAITSWFGLSDAPAQPRNVAPPTYLEQKRKEAQQQYLDEQKYLEKNRGELERLLEQDQQAMAAQAPGNLWEVMNQFKNPPPPPVPGQQPTAPNPSLPSSPQPKA